MDMLFGAGVIPDRSMLVQFAQAAYQPSAPRRIGGWLLVDQTLTAKAYVSGNTVVVAIRGTEVTDPVDLAADASLVFNRLDQSSRFSADKEFVTRLQEKYAPSQYDYYGVGHSLGGAILDRLVALKLIKGGVTYNPAVQPADTQTALPVQRIYQAGDPLLATLGRNAVNKTVMSATGDPSPWKQHQLDSFGDDTGVPSVPGMTAPHAAATRQTGSSVVNSQRPYETNEQYAARVARVHKEQQTAAAMGYSDEEWQQQKRRHVSQTLTDEKRRELDRLVAEQQMVANSNIQGQINNLQDWQKEAAIFNPILRGMESVASFGRNAGFLPKPVAAIYDFTRGLRPDDADYDRQEAAVQQRLDKLHRAQGYEEQRKDDIMRLQADLTGRGMIPMSARLIRRLARF